MSWNSYTYRILVDERIDQYMREAAQDRLAGEALSPRASLRRRSTSPWVRLLDGLSAGLQLGLVSPTRPWRGGTRHGDTPSRTCGVSCRD